jgi:hypothetical protein
VDEPEMAEICTSKHEHLHKGIKRKRTKIVKQKSPNFFFSDFIAGDQSEHKKKISLFFSED